MGESQRRRVGAKTAGKYEQAEDGAVLTLPNGNKYITKSVMDNDGPLAILLVFPNRQVFSSDAAKGVSVRRSSMKMKGLSQ